MSQHRQLAAIMFTDIEGYSSMMQQDEQKALATKNRHREILQNGHGAHNGRIIQYYGDGTLSTFQSAVEAVQCALGMQLAFRSSPLVPVRIGIHSGDIVFDEENIFGDGVNLAARIESLGLAGSILISDKVNDELNNHPEIHTFSVGTYEFKNITRKVEVFALDHEGLVKPKPDSLKGKTVEKKPEPGSSKNLAVKSIAVLPFVNMSNDPEQEFFGDGVAEEILNSLASLKDLKVASRNASFQFERNSDLREIGKKLGVSTVLEGSVRKQGRHLRVTVQLINVEDGFHLWSEKYDGDMDDIFAIQDEIALATTEKLKLTLLDADRAKITRSHTQNSEAYELYLKGRFHINRRGPYILHGIKCFEKAIELDPHFALAHTGFADANLMAAFYGLVPSASVIYKAKQSAETAIRLEPSRCEPYCSLGCFYTCFEWSWKEAEKNFMTSIEINARYAQAHMWYGSLYLAWAKGDFFRAETHGRIAIELEPRNAVSYGMFASVLHTAGKFNESLAACRTGLELDPDSFLCQLFLGWSHLFLNQYEEAINAFEELMDKSNRHHFAQNALIIAYCIVWRFDKGRMLRDDLYKRAKKEFVSFTAQGLAAACLEDMDEAFAYLEKGYEAHESMMLSLKYEHWIPEVLKEDPRYQQLLNKIGFPG